MNIIVRCCGERTEKKCISLAKQQGDVHIIKTRPFGECLRQSYKLALTFNQKWIPMIDGDVLLFNNSIINGINFLNQQKGNIFCLDGKTKDKIFMATRRAGIHIYNRELLEQAYRHIDDKQIKPESNVRKIMDKLGYKTVLSPIVFGYHDYEQYYCDLWRKGFAQSQKLARRIAKTKIRIKWKRKAEKDNDFKVILAAHIAAVNYKGRIMIDKAIDYNALKEIKKMGLREKSKL